MTFRDKNQYCLKKSFFNDIKNVHSSYIILDYRLIYLKSYWAINTTLHIDQNIQI